MAVFNDNNGAITVTGNYCQIDAMPPAQLDAVNPTPVGGDCAMFEDLGYLIVGDASAAGTVALQLLDAAGTAAGNWHNVTVDIFPLTLTASIIKTGKVSLNYHSARFAVTLSAGTLSYAELNGHVEVTE